MGGEESRWAAVARELLHAPPESDRLGRLIAGAGIRFQLLGARERPHDAELGGAGPERDQADLAES
jgi:hypothetical protein